MGLSVYLVDPTATYVGACPYLYSDSVTHNLRGMAKEAGLYASLWSPLESGYTTAIEIIPIIEEGLTNLKAHPNYYRLFEFDSLSCKYEDFVNFVESYLVALREFPEAKIEICK